MANLGNLFFDIRLNDNTDEDLNKIRAKLESLNAKAKINVGATDKFMNEKFSSQIAYVNGKKAIDSIVSMRRYVEEHTKAVEETTSKVRELISEYEQLSKEEQNTEIGRTKLNAISEAVAARKAESDEVTYQIRQQTNKIKMDKEEEGSITGLRKQLALLTAEYDKLGRERRESIEGKNRLKDIQAVREELMKAEAETGRFFRNVGNYASHWDGLNAQVQQLAREFPNLGMNFQTFVTSISNNLPMLADELAKANQEYKNYINELKKGNKEVQAVPPVWKRLVGAVLNWNTLLVGVITTLTLFGREIGDWVKGLVRGQQETDKARESMERLNQALLLGVKNAQIDIAHLDLLYKAATNVTKAMDERLKAVELLQKEYPNYFSNLDKELILNGKAQKSYEELSEAIIRSSRARALETKIGENESSKITLEFNIDQAYKELDSRNEELQKLLKKRTTIDYESQKQLYTAVTNAVEDKLNEIEQLEDRIESYRSEIQRLNKETREYVKNVNPSDYIKESEISGTVTPKPAPTPTPKSVNQKNDPSRYIRERIEMEVNIELQVAQARIDAMSEGSEKDIAQMNLNHSREMMVLKRQKEEYIRKVIEYMKAVHDAEESAKTAKNKGYKQKPFDSSSVNVDVSMFDTMEGSLKKKNVNDIAKYYQDILGKYKGYIEKRKEIEQSYANDQKIMKQQGANESQLGELEYLRKESLAAIDREFAMREQGFQVWANGIVNLSLEQLVMLLDNASKELERMQFINPNNPGLAIQRAKVGELRNKIAEKANDKEIEPGSEAIKEWKSLHKVLNSVSGEFKEIGDVIGGTVGKTISAAGEIASYTLTMLDGLSTLADASSKAIEGTAETTGKAMSSIEKASVILSIVSAGMKIATGIIGMFSGNDGMKEYEAAKEVYESYVNTLDKVIDKQLELAEALSGKNAKDAYQEAIGLIKQQTDAARELGKMYLNAGASKGFLGVGSKSSHGKKEVESMSMEGWNQAAKALGITVSEFKKLMGGRMTGLFDLTSEQLAELQKEAPSFWAQLDEDTRKYAEQVAEGVEQVIDILEKEMETATGISWDSFTDGILESLYDINSTTKDIANDMGEAVRKALIRAMYIKNYEPVMREWYETFAKFMEDGLISDDESDKLESIKAGLIDKMKEEVDALNKQWGTSGEGKEGLSAGFKGISEDTANLLASYLNAERGDISVIRAILEKYCSVPNINRSSEGFSAEQESNSAMSDSFARIQAILNAHGATMANTNAIAESQLQELKSIAESTRRTADSNDLIAEIVEDTRNILKRTTTGSLQIYVK